MKTYFLKKRNTWVRLLVSLFFSSLILSSFASPALADEKMMNYALGPVLRVGLWTNQSNVLICSDVDFQLIDGDNQRVLKKGKRNIKMSVTMKNGRFSIDSVPVQTHSIFIKAITTEDKERFIEVNGRNYRGDVELHQTKKNAGITVINILPVELYLYGILPQEISPEWPLEAIKAQAVAARTYALYNQKKHGEDGFDICSTSDCQVYGGMDSETSRTNKAVDETNGVTIMYQEKLIPAFFHSSAGGFTENSENVWGAYLPYLRGVEDRDQFSPYYKWERRFAPADLIRDCAPYIDKIGRLKAIELSALTAAPVTRNDRGVSGRVKTLRLIGDKGSIQVPGNTIRTLLNLPSTLFDVKMMSAAHLKDKSLEITHRITGAAGETVLFMGYGWGHGVGLSQWGAKSMAEQAPKNDAAYYKEILRHYYTGVDVRKSY
ncbi:MAG: SpoIID/LytB domain protein [Firmicutes bacterium]|nr:SpoIID/LytB domain protein [Bacillota bacterium]